MYKRQIEHKKRVCRGEFSTVILAEGVLPAKSKEEKPLNKLSRKEREVCFREMKSIQLSFIENMFGARKRYLDFLHQLRLKELDKAHKQALEELKSSFDKKTPAPRKRRVNRKNQNP